MENKKRLIDANALEKDMRAYADNKAYCGHIELANGILKAVGRIDEAPTVDAVEVVRCENCRWWKTKACIYHLHGVDRKSNDFCSDGDRKDAPLNYLGCTKC